jgi:hypothetical protein
MNSVFLYFIGFVPEIIENIKLLNQMRNEYIQKSHWDYTIYQNKGIYTAL